MIPTITVAAPLISSVGRTFAASDQDAFAALSGDHNPMHVDPVAARRLLFGCCVVHGVHLVCWALDGLLTAGELRKVSRLRARFVSAATVGSPVVAERRAGDSINIAATTRGGGRCMDLRVDLGAEAHPACVDDASITGGATVVPRAPAFGTLADASGALPLQIDRPAAVAAFPTLASAWQPARLAALLATSRLVGMEVPGLHSVFAELELTRDDAASAAHLSWKVTKLNERLAVVIMSVRGGGFAGRVQAMSRPAPVAQLSAADAVSHVAPTEFKDVRALVVGGSRGLGEVAAKLLAAGGADVVITYHRGRAEADAIAADIRATGGQCRTLPYHASGAANPSALIADAHPNQLYYFATPHIGRGHALSALDSALLQRLTEVYVTAFVPLATAMAGDGTAVGSIFYPSTVFLDQDDNEFPEYVAAKAGGEAACRMLAARYPSLQVRVNRLPRMPTDLSSSLFDTAAPSAPATLLPILRAMRS